MRDTPDSDGGNVIKESKGSNGTGSSRTRSDVEGSLLRVRAQFDANAADAAVWRWFSMLMRESRIRWCCAQGSWLVSVDNVHVATESDFDDAIRSAKAAVGDSVCVQRFSRSVRRRVAGVATREAVA